LLEIYYKSLKISLYRSFIRTTDILWLIQRKRSVKNQRFIWALLVCLENAFL